MDRLVKGALVALTVMASGGASARERFASEAELAASVLPVTVNIFNRSVLPRRKDEAGHGPALIKDEVGSGFIVDASGIIVTNTHVVDNAYSLSVTLSTGEHVPATLIGKALTFDIALIKIDVGHPLPVAKLGDSDALKIGEMVVAIGNPLGFSSSVSSGIVSAFHRTVGLSAYDDLIQTDTTINQGNSGGPLFNMAGEVIGVNQAIFTRNQGGSIGIGFSIPVNEAKFLVENVQKYGEPRFGWLGVTAQDLNWEMAKAADLPGQKGVIVSKIADGSAAEKAGLKVGDILTGIGGRAIDGTSALNRAVARASGVTLPVELFRSGAKMTINATIQPWPKAIWASEMKPQPKLIDHSDFGVEFSDTPSGPTVKTVVEKGVAWTAGLREGDVVRKVGFTDVKDIKQMEDVVETLFMEKGKTAALFLLSGPGGDRWVDLSVAE